MKKCFPRSTYKEIKVLNSFEVSYGYYYEPSLIVFLGWLKKQIQSNKRYSLSTQDLVLYKPSYSKLVFIMPEVLEQYAEEAVANAEAIKLALRDVLQINFAYTLLREDRVVEVLPCRFEDLFD